MATETRFIESDRHSKAERLMAGAGLGVFAAGCFVVGFLDPSRAGIFPGCPLLNVTGFACPGCGLTRGFHALFHGDYLTAISFNAMIPIYAFILTYLALAAASIAIRGRSLPFKLLTPTSLWIFLGLSFIFGVLRNIPAYPFSFLFP